jgi:hypothetical protein
MEFAIVGAGIARGCGADTLLQRCRGMVEGDAGGRQAGFEQAEDAAGFLAGDVAGAGASHWLAGEEADAGSQFVGEQGEGVGVSVILAVARRDEGGGGFAGLGGDRPVEKECVV